MSEDTRKTIRNEDTRETIPPEHNSTRYRSGLEPPTPPDSPIAQRTITAKFDTSAHNAILSYAAQHDIKHERMEARLNVLESEVDNLKAADDRSSAHDLTNAADTARLQVQLAGLQKAIEGGAAKTVAANKETTEAIETKGKQEWAKVLATFIGTLLAVWLATKH